MKAPQQLSLVDIDSDVHSGLPHAVPWTGNVVLQIDRLHKTRRCGSTRINLNNVALHDSVMLQDILDSFISVQSALSIGGLSIAKLASDRDLSHCLRFIGK